MVQRPHQILKQFANQGYKSILYNINSNSSEIIQISKNMYTYNKISPPLKSKNKRVMWISYPPLYKSVLNFKYDLLVFDCLDYPGEQFNYWNRGLEQLRETSDFIFVTSQQLYEFNKDYKSKTYICRNGADFDHFAISKDIFCDKPKDIKGIQKPIIGYFGAVADWIDWDLVNFLAEKNKFSIVFIGPLFKMNEIPIKKDNFFYLGIKDYNILPEYLQYFDVCIIPFLKSKLTSACNPIKMYEYLSAGKPVITTDLPECKVESVRFSDNYQEFFENIINCLECDNKEEIEKRILFAEENSWKNRVMYIRSVIEPRLRE